MGRKLQISEEQKVEAVLAVIRKTEPVEVISRRYSVSEATLYRLRDEFLSAGKAALQGREAAGSRSERTEMQRLQRDIDQRDQIIAELTVANRILKKISDHSS